MVDSFGRRGRLFIIHFRNVDQPLPVVRETFLSDGYRDMYKIIRKLAEVKFDGVLSADHVPSPLGFPRAGEAWTVGYIRALIERATENVFYRAAPARGIIRESSGGPAGWGGSRHSPR
jgi:mannonate dehydratase